MGVGLQLLEPVVERPVAGAAVGRDARSRRLPLGAAARSSPARSCSRSITEIGLRERRRSGTSGARSAEASSRIIGNSTCSSLAQVGLEVLAQLVVRAACTSTQLGMAAPVHLLDLLGQRARAGGARRGGRRGGWPRGGRRGRPDRIDGPLRRGHARRASTRQLVATTSSVEAQLGAGLGEGALTAAAVVEAEALQVPGQGGVLGHELGERDGRVDGVHGPPVGQVVRPARRAARSGRSTTAGGAHIGGPRRTDGRRGRSGRSRSARTLRDPPRPPEGTKVLTCAGSEPCGPDAGRRTRPRGRSRDGPRAGPAGCRRDPRDRPAPGMAPGGSWPRMFSSCWRAAICWAKSVAWMPWNRPSSQPTSWAWATRSSTSVGTPSSANGKARRFSSSRRSGDRAEPSSFDRGVVDRPQPGAATARRAGSSAPPRGAA